MEKPEYVCRLSEEEKSYVAVHLNETDEVRAAKIAEIREWITRHEQLQSPTDDFFILRFLRACKFNIEKTEKKLENYCRQRSTLSEWYDKRDPFLQEIQELLDLGVLLPLRKPDNEGRMVVIVRAAAHKPSRHKISDMLKAALMTLDLALRDHEPVTIYGISAILDMDGMTYEHVFQLPPHVIKNLVHAWQGCYPVRIFSLNFINAPTLMNMVLNIFRSFMSSKLKRRVHVHPRNKLKLYGSLPISILPKEYGGMDGTVKELSEYWKRVVEDNWEWLAEEKCKLTSPVD
ncbi:retinol-binding protein pinta [Calliopsis andreniformis]|uniref:retinol-binding protein pinta n=1 Tax=Calliopsis andreniformis TaxID=337506 RepID=UPI003FCCFBC2